MIKKEKKITLSRGVVGRGGEKGGAILFPLAAGLEKGERTSSLRGKGQAWAGQRRV